MKLSQKGQITIPKSIRDDLGLEVGEEVEFKETENGYVLRRKNQEVFSDDDVKADDPIATDTKRSLELTRGKLD